MKQRHRIARDRGRRRTDTVISRRSALGSSGVAVLGLLSGPALGQTARKEADAKKPPPQVPKEFQERMERQRAFGERLRDATSNEEREQIQSEQRAWQRQMDIDSLKDQLRVSEQEWRVVKPRLQAVYDLVRPAMVIRAGTGVQPRTEAERRSLELSKLVQEDQPDMGQIKANLTAYRAAKEKDKQEIAKARESLRQLMDLRQEAVLVLRGLLD